VHLDSYTLEGLDFEKMETGATPVLRYGVRLRPACSIASFRLTVSAFRFPAFRFLVAEASRAAAF